MTRRHDAPASDAQADEGGRARAALARVSPCPERCAACVPVLRRYAVTPAARLLAMCDTSPVHCPLCGREKFRDRVNRLPQMGATEPPCETRAAADLRRTRAALRVLVEGMTELSARRDDDVGPLAEVWLQVAEDAAKAAEGCCR